MQGSVTMTRPTEGAQEGHNEAMEKRFADGAAAAARGTTYVAPSDAPEAVPAVPAATPAATPAEAPAAPAATPAPAETPAATEGFIDGILKDTGLTRDSILAEFVAGGITDATYSALASKGVDRVTVDQYMGGVKAQAEATTAAYANEVMAAAGSPEKYTELVTWASGALSEAEIQAYNEAVNSGNAKLAAFAVAGLQARYTVANPAEPALINQGTPAGGVAGYDSWAQVTKDMRDPQYAKDPAYRAKVTERLRLSTGLQ